MNRARRSARNRPPSSVGSRGALGRGGVTASVQKGNEPLDQESLLSSGGQPPSRGVNPTPRGGPPPSRGVNPTPRGGPPPSRGVTPTPRGGGQPPSRGVTPTPRGGGPPASRGVTPTPRGGGPPPSRGVTRGGLPPSRGGPPPTRGGAPRGGLLSSRGGPPSSRGGTPTLRGRSPRRGVQRGRGYSNVQSELKAPVIEESEKTGDLILSDDDDDDDDIDDDFIDASLNNILSSPSIDENLPDEVKKSPPPLTATPPKSILKKEPQCQDLPETKDSPVAISSEQSTPVGVGAINISVSSAPETAVNSGANKEPEILISEKPTVMEEKSGENETSLNVNIKTELATNGTGEKIMDDTNGKDGDDVEMADVENPLSLKRKKGEKKYSPKKRRKTDHMVHKNPLMKLNEMKPGLCYLIEKQEGPSHNPTFYVSVTVDGEKHVGKGKSKQDAKHSAALAALSSFVQFPDQSEIFQMMPGNMIGQTDFTSDSVDEDPFFDVTGMKQRIKYGEFPQSFMPKKSRIERALANFETKSPVMLLNELHPGSEYTLVEEMSGIPAHRFTMAVNVNGVMYEGSGQSKKQAKAAAARTALVSIYQIPLTGGVSGMQTGNSGAPPISGLKQLVADKIASTVYETFSQIIVGFDDNKKWKVLSGIVMTTDEEMEKISVIGVSTGTKCINGEHISMNGASLNDCHAEIISRRCFKDFIYSQIEKYANETPEDSILVKKETGGFSLKPHVKFHLFISTAPCGDARIFSPHELEFGDKVDKHPNRKGRGLLRTKIEAGEGTIPVKPGESIQTWDGIQGGQRLLTMSCSDKIARWNVLGIQGTLLSLFTEPIYLDSIILGSMYHEDHMYRAIGKRIESTMGELPTTYRLTIPKINIVTSTETRQASKSPTYSVNWSLGLAKPEIVNGTTGKLHNGQLSRLAKRSFFNRFQNIRAKVSFLSGRETKYSNIYADSKLMVDDYQNAKEVVFKAFQEAGLGTWVKKPPEQDEFEVGI